MGQISPSYCFPSIRKKTNSKDYSDTFYPCLQALSDGN